MKFVFQIFGLIFLLVFVRGQHIVDHACPKRPVFTNFDSNKYLGKWYEISRYEQFFEIGCDCVFVEYSMNDDGSVKVRNCCQKLPNTNLTCIVGKAVVSYPNQTPLPAKLNVTFSPNEKVESNYWILDTDYENFSIVYLCIPMPLILNYSVESFWLLSRSKVLDEETRKKADNFIDKYFDKNALRVVKQSHDQCGTDY